MFVEAEEKRRMWTLLLLTPVPLMLSDDSQDVVRKVPRVLGKPEKLFELRFELLHVGLPPR